MDTEDVDVRSELEEGVKAPVDVRGCDLADDTASPDDWPTLEGDDESSWEDRLSILKQRITDLQEAYKV